jgi:hypothetical protein
LQLLLMRAESARAGDLYTLVAACVSCVHVIICLEEGGDLTFRCTTRTMLLLLASPERSSRWTPHVHDVIVRKAGGVAAGDQYVSKMG